MNVSIKNLVLATVCAGGSLISALAHSEVAKSELSASGTLTSDYIFRGVTQTDHGVALQAGADYQHGSGAYVGVWGSNVDLGDDQLEYDLIAGYRAEVAGISLDLGYVSYHLDESGTTAEAYLSASYSDATVTVFRDQDYGYHYVSAGYDFALPQDYTLNVAGGQWISSQQGDGVFDALVSVGKSYGAADVAIAASFWEGTDDSDSETTLFISVGTSF